jgi:hypothetical protein
MRQFVITPFTLLRQVGRGLDWTMNRLVTGTIEVFRREHISVTSKNPRGEEVATCVRKWVFSV